MPGPRARTSAGRWAIYVRPLHSFAGSRALSALSWGSLSGTGGLTFLAPGGSGTVVVGGGSNDIVITLGFTGH